MTLSSLDMFDAIYPQNIPANALFVGGYVDGNWPWMRTQPNLFPNAGKLTFCVFASSRARCLDVEKGNATPAQAPGWVLAERALGEDPWVYCSQLSAYGWQAVQDAFNAAHVPHPHYFIANYNNTRALPTLNGFTAIAHQYVDVGPYDLSSLSDTAVSILRGTPGPTPAPVPPSDNWTATMINNLPTLAQGAKDDPNGVWYVRRIQAMLNSVMAIPVGVPDGNFGPLTHSGVATFQQRNSLAVDGVVGPHTWALLLAGQRF